MNRDLVVPLLRPTADLPRRTVHACVVLALFSILTACGGRTEPALHAGTPSAAAAQVRSATTGTSPASGTAVRHSNEPASAPAAAVATAPRGVLLSGLPGANAYAALQAYTAESATSPSAPSPLTAFIDLSATVGQVNAALNSISARIVNMQPRRQAVAIEVAAGSGMLPAREAAARLVASRAFQWVQGPGLPAAPFALATDPAAPEPVDDHAPPP